jgi:hypothetical protein
MMEKVPPKVIAVIGLVAMAGLIVFTLLSNRASSPVSIRNYNDFVKNLPDSERLKIEAALYDTLRYNVKDVTKYAFKNVFIREDSYSQEQTGGELYTTFIVDVPEVHQSYRMNDTYSGNFDYAATSGDYRVMVVCLEPSELIFGVFPCQDNVSVSSGAPFSDPILKHLPYNTAFYQLKLSLEQPSEEKLQLKLTIYEVPREGIYATPERFAKYAEEVEAWFVENGLESGRYEIVSGNR